MKLRNRIIFASSLAVMMNLGYQSAVQAEAEIIEWSPRTVEEVAADLQETTEDTLVYTIQYGDTLGVISEAMNIDTERLATINEINNIDLIFPDTVLSAKYDSNFQAYELEIETTDGVVYEETIPADVVEGQTPTWVEQALEGEAQEAPAEEEADVVSQSTINHGSLLDSITAGAQVPQEEAEVIPAPEVSDEVVAPEADDVADVPQADVNPDIYDQEEVPVVPETPAETEQEPADDYTEDVNPDIYDQDEVEVEADEPVLVDPEADAELPEEVKEDLQEPEEFGEEDIVTDPVEEPAEEPVVETPEVEEPVYEEPEVEEPVYEEPEVEEPVYEEPEVEEPVYQEPEVEEPVQETNPYDNPQNAGLSYDAASYKEEVANEFGVTDFSLIRPGDPGDHGQGKAVDFMVYDDSALGDQIANHAISNMAENNISYVIWEQQIYGDWNQQWEWMEDRGSITANHYDHVHVSFH